MKARSQASSSPRRLRLTEMCSRLPDRVALSINVVTPNGKFFRAGLGREFNDSEDAGALLASVMVTAVVRQREAHPMRPSGGIHVWLACDEPNVWDLKSEGEWIGQIQFHPEGYFVIPKLRPDLIQIAAGPYRTVEQAMDAVSAHLGSPCKPGVTL